MSGYGFRGEMVGRKFNRLLVAAPAGKNWMGQLRWHCRCDCGGSAIVEGIYLRNGKTKSCGCLRTESAPRKNDSGYVVRVRHGHPHAAARGLVREHREVAARALGRPIPSGAHVHHVNGRRDDNRPQNLVICQDGAYHALLHRRARLVRIGRNPDETKACSACGQPKPLGLFSFSAIRHAAAICLDCRTAKRAEVGR